MPERSSGGPRGRHDHPGDWLSTVVPAGDRHVPVRVFRPAAPGDLWLVWAHGGSWTGGAVDGVWHVACADLARLAGATVVSVEYRLAPEHPHPAALHDVLAVMDWTEERAAAERAGSRIAVGGDSAGGTIAACAALVWRDRHRPLGAQVLAYPPIDPECGADSYRAAPESFPSRAGLLGSWLAYRGSGYRWGGAPGLYSTPAEATELTGVAPVVLAVGGLDPVVDDVRRYADRLDDNTVPVRFREFPHLGHGAFLTPPPSTGPDDPLRSWLGAALRAVLKQPMRDDAVAIPPRRAVS